MALDPRSNRRQAQGPRLTSEATVPACSASALRLPIAAGPERRLERKRRLAVTIKTRNRDRHRGTVAKRRLVLRAR